ncbi:MAG: hypothetical protein J6Q78_02170 [Clostridia bacterium]|nr:hypothetical protein [Clostridia bacterium]
MLIEGKVLMNSYICESEKYKRLNNPTEIFLNDELLRLSEMLSSHEKNDTNKMSDFEKFAFVCSAIGRGKGTRLFDDFVEEIFCVFTLMGEREYIDSLISKDEIDSYNASEIWRRLCFAFGNIDSNYSVEKNNEKNGYQVVKMSEYAVEKNNNIKYSADIEEALKNICVDAEDMVGFAEEFLKHIENKGINDIIICIEGRSDSLKTDKYHCDAAFEKYCKGEALDTDEKFSLYYGLIYQVISKNTERKIQLNIVFDNMKNAFYLVKSIEKSFSNIRLSDMISIGFDSSCQEKNIAEYFYSANNKQGIFPIFICHKNIPEAELFVSLLRLSRILPLEYVTFILENEESSRKLFECIRSLRAMFR